MQKPGDAAVLTAKARDFSNAVVFGIINGIVGIPTMISFATIIYKVRPFRPACTSTDLLALHSCPPHAAVKSHLYGVLIAGLMVLQDPAYSQYLGDLAKLGFFASGVHQAVFTIMSTLPYAVGQVQVRFSPYVSDLMLHGMTLEMTQKP